MSAGMGAIPTDPKAIDPTAMAYDPKAIDPTAMAYGDLAFEVEHGRTSKSNPIFRMKSEPDVRETDDAHVAAAAAAAAAIETIKKKGRRASISAVFDSSKGNVSTPTISTKTRRGSITGMFSKAKEESSVASGQPAAQRRGSIFRRKSVSAVPNTGSMSNAEAAAAASAAANSRRRGSITGLFTRRRSLEDAPTFDPSNMSNEEAAAAAAAAAARNRRRGSIGGDPKFIPSKEAMANAIAKAEASKFEADLEALAGSSKPKKNSSSTKSNPKGEIKVRAIGQKWRKKFVLIENGSMYIGPGPQAIRQREPLGMSTARVGKVDKFGFALQYTSSMGNREILQFQALEGKSRVVALFVQAVKDASKYYEESSDDSSDSSSSEDEDSSDEDEESSEDEYSGGNPQATDYE